MKKGYCAPQKLDKKGGKLTLNRANGQRGKSSERKITVK